MDCSTSEMTGNPSVLPAHLLAPASCMPNMDGCAVYSGRTQDISNKEVADMSPRFLFRSSGLALVLGSLFGLFWTLMSALIVPLANPNQFASSFFLIASLFMLVVLLSFVTV